VAAFLAAFSLSSRERGRAVAGIGKAVIQSLARQAADCLERKHSEETQQTVPSRRFELKVCVTLFR
jgi:hypothetical protein